MNTTVSDRRVSSGRDAVDRLLSPKLSSRIWSWFTPRVDRIWRALSMNPLGPQRKKVGESRWITCCVTNSAVRRPLGPFQVGSGRDRHTSYLKSARDLLSLASSLLKIISAL